MSQASFIEELKKLGIKINNYQLEQLEKYYNLLIEWNKVMNLTGIIKKEEVYLKHFYDSLTIIKGVDLNQNLSVCDIGTGAGFPGLVLKIVFPNLNITLIDSLNKRIKFLNIIIDELNLKNIVTIHGRSEEYGRINQEIYDVVTARAVAPLNILLEYCIPLLKVGGIFVPMKGNITEEINNTKNAFKKLNASIIEIIDFKLPIENSTRTILKSRKTKKTNSLFPRKYNEIKKNPL